MPRVDTLDTVRTGATANRPTSGLPDVLLREVFGAVPTSVVAVCAMIDGAPGGMVFSTFTAVSMHPPLVSVCVGNSSGTWPLLRRAPRLGVSVLGAWHTTVSTQLAGPYADRFTGLGLRLCDGGGILLDDAAAWLECSLRAEIPAGDHRVALLDIHALGADRATAPLVYRHSRCAPLAA